MPDPISRSFRPSVSGRSQACAMIRSSSGECPAVRSLLPAHGSPGDLADLVLDLPSAVGALGHGKLVGVDQERRRTGSGGKPLSLSYPGEILIVLAGPVDVHTARGAVPLFVRSLCAALRALHGPHPGSLGAPARCRPGTTDSALMLPTAIPIQIQRSGPCGRLQKHTPGRAPMRDEYAGKGGRLRPGRVVGGRQRR